MSVTRFDVMKNQSEEFSAAATKLSELLQSIEVWLSSLPGKVAVTIECGDGKSLAYGRHSDAWQLVWISGGEAVPVCCASIAVKAQAAHHLNNLLAAIEDQQRFSISDGRGN